jgi:hypothetical protein
MVLMRSTGLPELLILMFLLPGFVVVTVVPFWRIFSKAGYPGVLAFTQFVPLVNVIVLFVVAFSQWPIERELTSLRGMQSARRGDPAGPARAR